MFPKKKLTAVTGVSGSGKSTLAFGIVFAEGQRRYLESLNAYARTMVQPAARAEADRIVGISPTVAIEQRTSRGGNKSTVATMTEIQHFLRLIYLKLGVQYCPDCHVPVKDQSFDAVVAAVMRRHKGKLLRCAPPLSVTARAFTRSLPLTPQKPACGGYSWMTRGKTRRTFGRLRATTTTRLTGPKAWSE